MSVRPPFRYLEIAYYVLCGTLWLVLLRHRSESPAILTYSKTYALFLIFFLAVFLVPRGLRFVHQRFKLRVIAFSLIPASVVLILTYWGASTYYYHSLLYPYDPFLQVPPKRFPPEIFEKQPASFRILVMGGSTTENSQYPAILEQMLREARPQARVEILNSGMRSWTTKHTLIEYATYAHRLKPDLVIVMHGINDLTRSCEPSDLSFGPYNDDWSHFYYTTINTVIPKTFERHLFDKYFGIAYSLYGHEEVDYPVSHFRALAPFERNLQDLARYVAADGATPIFLTQPSDWNITPKLLARGQGTFASILCKSDSGFLTRAWPSPQSMRRAMAAFNDAVRRAGERTNTLVVDVAAEIPEDEEYFLDEVHHTEKCSRTIAAVVAKSILDNHIITESR